MKTAGTLAAQQSAEVTKQLENLVPPSTVTVSGSSNTVSISTPPVQARVEAKITGTQQADGTDSAMGSTATSIPLGVKIALLAGGLLLLLLAVKLIMSAIKSTASGKAAVEAADRVMAATIERIDDMVATESDATRQAKLLSTKAQLEKQRGQHRAR